MALLCRRQGNWQLSGVPGIAFRPWVFSNVDVQHGHALGAGVLPAPSVARQFGRPLPTRLFQGLMMRCMLLNKSMIGLLLGVCLTLCGCEQGPPASPGNTTKTTSSTTVTATKPEEPSKKEEPPKKEEAPVKAPSAATKTGSTTGPGVKE